MIPKQLVILGGGASVVEGIDKGLFNLLPNVFCCGLNYSYKFVETTCNAGVDSVFYNNDQKTIDALPLYIGKVEAGIRNPGPNTFWFPATAKDPKTQKMAPYHRDLLYGVYHSTLVGLFSLSLFIKLMDEGEIYLLGYDYGPARTTDGKYIVDSQNRPLTHWYQGKVEHRGVGKINWYTATLIDTKEGPTKGSRITQAENEFRVYRNESKVKIYNVSMGSAIPTFPKISYDEFFSKKLISVHNQNEVRNELKEKLKVLQVGIRTGGEIAVPPNCNVLDKKEPFDVSNH